MHPQQPQGYPPAGHGGAPPQAAGPSNPAQLAGILALVCALLIAIGTFTKSWVTGGEGRFTVGIGLLGASVCRGGECQSADWDQMGKGVDGDIKIFGYLGFIGGLGAIGVAAAAGGLALSRNHRKIPYKPFYMVLSVAGFAFGYFFVRVMMQDGVSIGFSGVLALLGLGGLGFVMKQMLKPLIDAAGPAPAMAYGGAPPGYAQPGYGQPPAQAMPQAMPYAAPPGAPPQAAAVMQCPRCGGQAQYVAQYQRYFCHACQQYA